MDTTTLAEQLQSTTIEHLGADADAADLAAYRAALKALWPVGATEQVDSEEARALCDQAIRALPRRAILVPYTSLAAAERRTQETGGRIVSRPHGEDMAHFVVGDARATDRALSVYGSGCHGYAHLTAIDDWANGAGSLRVMSPPGDSRQPISS